MYITKNLIAGNKNSRQSNITNFFIKKFQKFAILNEMWYNYIVMRKIGIKNIEVKK